MSALHKETYVAAQYNPDGSGDGIFATMGKMIGLNVSEVGVVMISAPPSISMPVTSITSRFRFNNYVRYISCNLAPAWICFDCRDWWIQPTHYKLSSGEDETMELVSWVLEGSNDKVEWFCLDERRLEIQDRADDNVYRCMDLNCFRYFKVTQTSANSTGTHNLAVAEFDLYGEARKRGTSVYIPPAIHLKFDEPYDGLVI